MQDREEEGKAHMRRVWRKRNPDDTRTVDEIIDSSYQYQKQSTSMDASSTTFKTAVFGKKYWKASWVGFAINCFNQLSGINAVNVYANRLLERM